MLRIVPLLFALAAFPAASRLSASQRLSIDPARSTVEVAVKATFDSFTARLDAYDARVSVDAEAGRITGAEFAFAFADLHTGKAKRDTAMVEWLAEEHPAGRFVLRQLEPLAADRWQATGTFHLHGQARDLAFPVVITTDRQLYALDGEAAIDTRDYGLPVIRLLGMLKVDPVVRVRFHLQGGLAP